MNLDTISSSNFLSPARHQPITLSIADFSSIGPSRTKVEISNKHFVFQYNADVNQGIRELKYTLRMVFLIE